MAHLLLLLSVGVAVRGAPGPITSRDTDTHWNCPAQESIETAYYSWCAAQDKTQTRELIGAIVDAEYSNAPTSYQTNTDDLELFCNYGTSYSDTDYITCHYYAGGGESIRQSANSDQSADCPDLSQTVPQPSPGVNYRRRQQAKRAIPVGTTSPAFVCPWTSDDADTYLTLAETGGGVQAPGNSAGLGFSTPATKNTQIYYSCYITVGSGSVSCDYLWDPDTGLEYAGDTTADYGVCPETLCDAKTSGTHNMGRRGVFIETNRQRLQSRQVKASDLRARLKR